MIKSFRCWMFIHLIYKKCGDFTKTKPKSLSMKCSQADSRVKILTRLSAWDNFMKFCRYESFKTQSLYWSYSVSSSMWNSAHIVFLHEFYMAITSEKATQRWTNLYNGKVCIENLTVVTKNSLGWTWSQQVLWNAGIFQTTPHRKLQTVFYTVNVFVIITLYWIQMRILCVRTEYAWCAQAYPNVS